MRSNFSTFFLPLIFLPSAIRLPAQRVQPEFVERSGGTVNIILSNGQDLVAVTDSMLTFSNPLRHEPTGTKLYKIDDKTLCTMAGLYSNPGPNGLSAFTAIIPQIMQEVAESERRFSKAAKFPRTFREKVNSLILPFQFRLTSNLQALVAADSNFSFSPQDLLLELTVAGYDLDGSLRIEDITLLPKRSQLGVSFELVDRPHGPIVPGCELAAEMIPERYQDDGPLLLKRLRPAFFCEIAGIADVAEKNLADTAQQTTALQETSETRTEKHVPLIAELQDLALKLERETALDQEKRGLDLVGGTPQIAILSEGRMSREPEALPPFPTNIGRSLGGSQSNGLEADCGPWGGKGISGGGGQMSVTVRHCSVDIDGTLYHDSKFIDSDLLYGGRGGTVIFAASNIVENSRLHFAQGINVRRDDLFHLACSFPWKAVYLGQIELKGLCDSGPAKVVNP